MSRKSITNLLISIAAAELVGVASWLFSGGNSDFYKTLIKPPLAPPPWLFGVMWPIMYVLMGISVYLVITSGRRGVRSAVWLYAVQLFVNFWWSIVFFRFNSIMGALAVIVLLTLLVLVCVTVFRRFSKTASYLMIPYLLWTSFATYLNVGIFLLN